jgi:L-serine dehydratase
MRGPSSSHTAASVRIGRIARDLMDARLDRVLVEFHTEGSLATTHESQGTDMGLLGGLMGWDTTHERLAESPELIRSSGIDVDIRVSDFPADHPNTYKLTLSSGDTTRELIALSTGGGMIEVVSIDRIPVSLVGDTYVNLFFVGGDDTTAPEALQQQFPLFDVSRSSAGEAGLFVFRGPCFLDDTESSVVARQLNAVSTHQLAPVLPVLTPGTLEVPFLSAAEMLAYKPGDHRSLADWAISYECARGDITRDEVIGKMTGIVKILKRSVAEGIAGTEYEDRILHHQCGRFEEMMRRGQLLEGGLLNHMILYVTALMEVKSSMGIIVAAPTAGSCGAMPGAILAATDVMGLSERDAVDAMLAAGLIGMFVAARSSFAAEVGGCQAETGAGAAMAAAGLVTLAKGSVTQALGAASMALQNTLGLICDPVANRVEAPCLGRNITAAANALSSANVSLADFDALIPLDEVIATHFEIGNNIPAELRCTCLGGLSITPASRAIEKRLGQAAVPLSIRQR